MVCSTCGYENQVGNRFCGMCGVPLPHRPLTAPGAQSTASLTHALGESRARTERRASDPIAVSSSLDVASPRDARDQDSQSVTSSDPSDLSGEPPPSNDQRSKVAQPQFDLVPEIPLDEYVQKFRYVPPSDPGEFTMRGDTTAIEPAPPVAPEAPQGTPVTPVETATTSAEIAPAQLPEDVRERLGLEVTTEERTDRPRFLDFNDPPVSPAPADSKPEDSVTPISGPSFLGLGNELHEPVATADELVVEEPAHGRWRIWLAAAVVVVFGSLGVLEWRAQVHQTNNGPVEVIKMKMRSLTRSKPRRVPAQKAHHPPRLLIRHLSRRCRSSHRLSRRTKTRLPMPLPRPRQRRAQQASRRQGLRRRPLGVLLPLRLRPMQISLQPDSPLPSRYQTQRRMQRRQMLGQTRRQKARSTQIARMRRS